MQLTAITIPAYREDLPALDGFYGKTLALPTHLEAEALSVQCGQTMLTFRAAPHAARTHFAFNVPPTRFAAALSWLQGRVPLLADSAGRTLFPFQDWNAEAVYFTDPVGHILELIVRHNWLHPQPSAEGAFSADELLCLSEIGLAVEEMQAVVPHLRERLGIPLYRTAMNDEFVPMGDEDGLLIIVKAGRLWFPETGVPAARLPVIVDLQTETGNWRFEGERLTLSPNA